MHVLRSRSGERWPRAPRASRLRRARAGALLAGLAALALLAVACGGDDEPGGAVRSATSTETAQQQPAATTPCPTETPLVRSTKTPAPGEVVNNVQDFVRDYGWPENSSFAKLRIPAIGVDTRVGSSLVGGDGVMADPAGPADVVWYDMAMFRGMGGKPGEGGNSIMSGHVDYDYTVPYAKVRFRGQGVFSKIHELKKGDVIEVERGCQKIRYEVVWEKEVAANSSEWGSIWSSEVPKESLTLYTCGGAFNPATFEYSHRIVVRAERV